MTIVELVRYLEDNDNATWSYAGFLTLHRDILLKSPPYLDKWFHLDGRWASRFLYEVKELNPRALALFPATTIATSSLLEIPAIFLEVTSYKHRFDFVYFTKKILANQTHLNVSMDLLGIAGKQNFQKMTSRGCLKTFSETNELQMSYT
ncbi:6122_t:CDS:2 [Ambispora leptoticha]|uniref:6122_t:CDS:1 n=1 Tax=Ambispora leptoticha TaxID=144679 RepID=A0A9N9BAT7_9GLOM|nr:6122_t:CDS:2 [Ambispora leptoticha]